MDMVNLNIQLNHLPFLLLDKGSYTMLSFLRYFANQYSESVLRDKDYMILAVPYRL